jgi:hypothetical protein
MDRFWKLFDRVKDMPHLMAMENGELYPFPDDIAKGWAVSLRECFLKARIFIFDRDLVHDIDREPFKKNEDFVKQIYLPFESIWIELCHNATGEVGPACCEFPLGGVDTDGDGGDRKFLVWAYLASMEEDDFILHALMSDFEQEHGYFWYPMRINADKIETFKKMWNISYTPDKGYDYGWTTVSDRTDLTIFAAMGTALQALRSPEVRFGETPDPKKMKVKLPTGKAYKKIKTTITVVPKTMANSSSGSRFVNWSHMWEVMGHWRRIPEGTLGKDPWGKRVVPGMTYVKEHTKGKGRLIKKDRQYKGGSLRKSN